MYGRVQAVDELEMCVSRLRLPLPYEQDIEAKIDVVQPYEVDFILFKFLFIFFGQNINEKIIIRHSFLL